MIQLALDIAAPLTIALSVVMAVVFILAGIYDISMSFRSRAIDQAVRRLRRSVQPSVTALVYVDSASDELDSALRRCLSGLNSSQYHKLDIVIVYSQSVKLSKDAVAQLKSRSKYPIRLFHLRSQVPQFVGLRRGYAVSRKGSVVVAIDAYTRVTPQLIKRTVASLELDSMSRPARFRAGDQRELGPSTIGAIFASQSIDIFQKALLAWGWWRTGPRVGFGYPAAIFSGKMPISYFYDSSLVVAKPQRWYGLPMYIKIICLLGFVVFALISGTLLWAAVTLVTPAPFLLIYLLVCAWLLIAVRIGDQTGFTKKLYISLTIPSGYFIVMATVIVQGSHWLTRMVSSKFIRD